MGPIARTLALAGGLMSGNALAAPTTFTVAMPEPHTHLYAIAMEVAPFAAPVGSFDLVMPVWTPGSYAVRDFARNVRDLEAESPSGKLAVSKVEKSRWRVSLARPARGPFTVRYKVYANELTVRTSHLDASHGYGNGTSLFFYVEGRKAEPQQLRFVLPAGWKVSLALPEAGGTYRATDYDELVDSPFECGTHRTYDFTVRGVPHTLALYGRGNEDPERLVKDLERLVDTAAGLFSGLPYQRYLFLVHLAEGASGGLEHRASQTDGIKPWRFKPEKSYREVLSLFSHELFHAWNVKRIHPAALGPFDYTREVHTRDLWAMEGVTSYYEWLLLVRAGLVKPKHAFEAWAKDIKDHRESPGTYAQSAEEASFDAWIRLYRPDENSPNVSESYYRRGALLGLALDLAIRRKTEGKASLDDVMRALYAEYASKGVGYPEGTYEATVARVLGEPETRELFDRYVRGRETPPFETLLPAVGLELHEKPQKDDDEKERDEEDGAKKRAAPEPVGVKSEFGWKVKKDEGRLLVSEVYAGRAAYRAGVNAGDELIAFDGFRADEDFIKRLERDAAPGTPVAVTLFRRGRLTELPVPLGERRAFTYEIRPLEKAADAQTALFEAWMKQPFPRKDAATDKAAAAERPENGAPREKPEERQ